jgi:hypothetical protein
VPDLPSVPRLYLIRHALPEGDSPRRYLGLADPGLGATGREQARGLARAHPGAVGLPVWTSPLRRALETARLAFPGAELRVEPLAAELSFGVLDGLLPEEAARLYPEAYAHLQRNPLDAAPCGGETWADLLDRATALAVSLSQSLVGGTLAEGPAVTLSEGLLEGPTAAPGEGPAAGPANGSKHPPSGAVLVAHRYLLAALVQALAGPAATATVAAPATASAALVRGLDYAESLVLETSESPPTVGHSTRAGSEILVWHVVPEAQPLA